MENYAELGTGTLDLKWTSSDGEQEKGICVSQVMVIVGAMEMATDAA